MWNKIKFNLIHPKVFLWLGIFIGLSLFFLEIQLDTLYFDRNHGSYLEALLLTDAEGLLRLLSSLLFFALGFLAFLYARKSKHLNHLLNDERLQSLEALRINEERLRLSQEAANQGWFDVDLKSGEVKVSANYIKLIGYDPDSFHSNLKTWRENIHPEDLAGMDVAFKKCLENGGPASFEYRRHKNNGDWIWIHSIGMIVSWGQNHEPLRMIGIHTDITERKAAEVELQLQKQYLRTLIDTEPECVKVLSPEGDLLDMNNAGLGLLDVESIEEVKNIGLINFIDVDYRPAFIELHQRVMGGAIGTLKFPIKSAKGNARWLETHAAPLKNEHNEVVSVIAITRDISEQQAHETELINISEHDYLTELPNRTLLTDRLVQAIAQAKRVKGTMALLFLDLDKFKPVNDTFGHDIGDLLLQEVAKRLQNCVKREMDTVSRFGGDEFVILLPQIESEQDAKSVASMVINTLNIPFEIEQHTLNISCSIGVAIYPSHGTTGQVLLHNADYALYMAKEAGGECFRLYSNSTH